ncbi:MAG: FmdB family zinc ribbon protein [Candidatus Thioglobus sp.]|jgi:putative FmdB family regulatory protein
MPLFEYKCKSNHVSEHIVSFDNREEPQVCPDCGEPSHFKQTFCTNFQYNPEWATIASQRKSWNKRENHRLGTKGRSYA